MCKRSVIWVGILVFSLLSNLSAYCQSGTDQVSEKYNPVYHFYPSIDPSGLFYHGGQYFLNWGSATSKDLVHWKITEFGLDRNNMTNGLFGKDRIENPFGANSPFLNAVISMMSGTVVIDWNNSSGLGFNGEPPLVAVQGEVSFSNDTAKSWKKASKPLLIQNSSGTHRDPIVFWYEPGKQWIMVMPWCEIQEIRFFSSKNLVDWKYESKFGPWGASGGQWECVEFFPLPVDNDPLRIKWVLVISVQPRNGQYFIGDFDGKRFTLDKDFKKYLSYDRYLPSGEMLFDFERSIDDWKIEGTAFNDNPTIEEGVNGKEGVRSIKSNPAETGKITSPEFTITKNYIDFLIGGGNSPGNECINLVVDGKIVRTQTGNGGNAHVNWTGWDVTEFRDQKARIEIIDNLGASNWMEKAYIYCDAILLSDELPKPPYKEYNQGWEKAFWIDWGADFYAVRAWRNYAPGEKRIIWAGWMGNWKYINEPVLGNFSISRNVELKTFPEGIRLIQNPIEELKTLRNSHKTAYEYSFEGIWKPKKFSPAKNSYELIVEFENISAKEFGLKLCVGHNEQTIIGYKVPEEELYVDRLNSGYDDFSSLFPEVNAGPLRNRNNTVELHIFIDKCSIEVFGNNGETVISSKIYPDSSSLGIELFSNFGKVKVKSLDLWDLGSIILY
jgi:fructan beta-fructosidase